MLYRITGKKIEQWLKESTFAKAHGLYYTSFSGCHYIYDDAGNTIAWGTSPSKCWERYCTFKAGYMLAMEDIKRNREVGMELC